MSTFVLSAALVLSACGGDSDSNDDFSEAPAPRTQPDPVTNTTAADAATMGDYAVAEEEYDFGRMTVYDNKNGDSYDTDIHGYIQYPQDADGPFPVVLFLHGRHGTCYDGWGIDDDDCANPIPSFRGYEYISENLASHGYAVISVDANDINDNDSGPSNGDTGGLARAMLVVRHLDEFRDINAAGGLGLDALMGSEIGIMGHSRGGHVTAAAVEQETHATANNHVEYDGAVPMCGVVADTFEFQYLARVTMAAQHLAHFENPEAPPLTAIPATNFDVDAINAVVWDTEPTFSTLGVPSEAGEKMQALVRNLSGGQRPLADTGFRTYYWGVVMGTGGRGGDVNGILTGNLTGNAGVTYQFDNFPPLTTEEQAFNDTILRVEGDPAANARRDDGLRWIPVINGEFTIPVVSLQGLGDLYVPFRHGQLYRERAEANGNGGWLVQRAIRSPGHCDYTLAEQETAFADMIDWEQNQNKPAGDDFLTPSTVAADTFGCAFSTSASGDDEAAVQATRPSAMAACVP